MTKEDADSNASRVTQFVQEVDRTLRGHGVVGNVTFAFIALAAMVGVAVWSGGHTAAPIAIKWMSGVFVVYLAGVLWFSYVSPESAAMEGSQLLEWRLATKEAGPLPTAPTVRSE